MSWLTTLFHDIGSFFASPKAKAVEAEIAQLLPVAMTVVEEINAMAPNRTLAEINLIAQKYALPTIAAISADPNSVGNTLLNLATAILQKNHAPDALVSTLQTVVQLAVTALKTQQS